MMRRKQNTGFVMIATVVYYTLVHPSQFTLVRDMMALLRFGMGLG
jgi:hypothetical protein